MLDAFLVRTKRCRAHPDRDTLPVSNRSLFSYSGQDPYRELKQFEVRISQRVKELSKRGETGQREFGFVNAGNSLESIAMDLPSS
jgi:hypothetical protein